MMMERRIRNGNRVQVLTIKEMIVGGLILALPIMLILLEPDVGSVLTYLPLLAVVLFLSAIRVRLVVASALLAIVLIPVAYVMGVKTGAVKPYQQERINVILDPENADKRRIGYHTWQSIITVGEGGLFGSRSSVEHSQSGLKFLPEPHTDFYLCGPGRECRVYRLCDGAAGVWGAAVAIDYRSASLVGSRRYAFHHGVRGRTYVSDLHQYRHGTRNLARHRCALTLDERRSRLSHRDFHRHRLRHQRSTAKVRQLAGPQKSTKKNTKRHKKMT
jgi:hypothetical protein